MQTRIYLAPAVKWVNLITRILRGENGVDITKYELISRM